MRSYIPIHTHTRLRKQSEELWPCYFVQTAFSLSILYYTWIYTLHLMLIHNVLLLFFSSFFFLSAQHFMHASMFITTVTMFSSTHAHTCHNLANQQCTHTRKETGWVQSPPPPPKNVFSSSEKKCLTNNIIIDHQYNISKEKIIPVAANSSKDNKCQQFGWRF